MKKTVHRDPDKEAQRRLDQFAGEYECKFSHYMWRRYDDSLKHRINAMGQMGSGISIIGTWCDSFAEAVDQVFSKIESED